MLFSGIAEHAAVSSAQDLHCAVEFQSKDTKQNSFANYDALFLSGYNVYMRYGHAVFNSEVEFRGQFLVVFFCFSKTKYPKNVRVLDDSPTLIGRSYNKP